MAIIGMVVWVILWSLLVYGISRKLEYDQAEAKTTALFGGLGAIIGFVIAVLI